MEFYSPSSTLKELDLLKHIERNPRLSQHEIARKIGSAASMVNVYIERLEVKGYLVRDYQSSKTVYYNITSEGVKRKDHLSKKLMKELFNLYSLAKENVEQFLLDIEVDGYKKILIYGAGEITEMILGVILNRNRQSLKVVAVVDDDNEIMRSKVFGFRVISRNEIYDYEHDALVIINDVFENEIRDRLKESNYPQNKILRFFS